MIVYNRQCHSFKDGTYLLQQPPWGWFAGGKALCTDGKVRTLTRINETAEIFFSVPAEVKVKGKTVSGFVTTDHS